MKIARLFVLAGIVGLFVPACTSPAVQVHTAQLPTAPFATYRTFSFGPAELAPKGYAETPASRRVEERMAKLVLEELERKGYTLANGTKGDLVFALAAGRRDVVVEHPRPTLIEHPDPNAGEWLAENEQEDFVEGAIVIDVFDGANDGHVWHGAARAAIDPSRPNDDLLRRAVRDVLASFPDAQR